MSVTAWKRDLGIGWRFVVTPAIVLRIRDTRVEAVSEDAVSVLELHARSSTLRELALSRRHRFVGERHFFKNLLI